MADRLERYRSMRDFEATPEPAGETEVPPEGGRRPRFVVQEHHARRLHWDLRLERDGALASWAVPRGIPLDPDTNHLAVHTEDHPLMYLEFSGEIPKGSYGAGSMSIWDQGTYECHKWEPHEVQFTLHGERVRGRYVLFFTGPRGGAGEGRESWMLHRMDPPEDPDREPLPERLAPMQAQVGGLPDDDERWGFEIKWDGVRALAYVEGGRLCLMSRNQRDVTAQYPELRGLGPVLGARPVLLDGEVVALDENGRPSFQRLQQRMHVASEAAVRRLVQSVPVAYMIFDLLHLDGRSALALPYEERRRRLAGLELAGPHWQTPAFHVGDGAALLEVSRAQGLEGVVAKRLDSRYEPGRRSPCWIKIKNWCRQEVVVGGWMPGEGARSGRFGALLVGHHQGGHLRYAGRVGTGFTDKELARLAGLLDPLRRDTCPFDPPPPAPVTKLAVWVEPRLVAEVAFSEWTTAGTLRQPAYKGLRDDVDPASVRREEC